MRPGYKQTEIGVLPKEWQVVQLANLLEFRNGVNADKEAYGKGISFINVLEVITHTHIHRQEISGRVTLKRGLIELFAVRHGDLVFNRTSETQEELGLCSVYMDDEEVVFGGFVIRGRPKESPIDATYSGYAFRSPAIRSQIIAKGQGAIRANIGQADLRQVLAPLLPLHEQRAIGAALSNADALIDMLDRLIAKKREFKTGCMQQLLTSKKRLPGFSGEWDEKQLKDIGTFAKGKGIKKDDVVADGIPCIRYGEIYTYYNDYIRDFRSFISPKVAKQSQRLRKGDLLFAGSGETAEEIGKCVAFIGDDEVYAGGDIVIFTPTNQNSMYLGYLMNHASIADQKARMGQGDAVVHISARNLGQLQLHIPKIDEQTAIALVLSDMDAEIAALEARRDKTLELKQGMMQQLLTGNIRLA